MLMDDIDRFALTFETGFLNLDKVSCRRHLGQQSLFSGRSHPRQREIPHEVVAVCVRHALDSRFTIAYCK